MKEKELKQEIGKTERNKNGNKPHTNISYTVSNLFLKQGRI